MQTTTCAYCDHEVKITPDGVCLYCGGNLAEEPIEETDDNGKTRLQRIRDLLGIYPDPLPNKSYSEMYKMYMGKSGTEMNLQTARRKLKKEEQTRKELTDPFFNEVKENYVSREAKVKAEMQELDNFTKIVGESTTVKDLVKSLDKPLIPFWLKFGAFLLGIIIGAFYAFPDIQIPLLETIALVNSSPYLILAMSFFPILLLIMIIQKFDRRMF